jgi:hypothetical protein
MNIILDKQGRLTASRIPQSLAKITPGRLWKLITPVWRGEFR